MVCRAVCRLAVVASRKVPSPRQPPARTETLRAALRAALSADGQTAHQLSGATGMSERDVVQHLEHLARSLRGAGARLEVEPAHCLSCGFSFTTRQRLGRPSRCPACKSERLEPPLFRLVEAAPER